jgi:hypothetical protein
MCHPDRKIVRLDYAGNMGADQDCIAECFDALYGPKAFNEIANKGWFAQDTQGNMYDDPSYLWVRHIPVDDFPFSLEGLED